MKKASFLVSVGLFVLVALVAYLATSRPVGTVQELSQAEFLGKVQSNLIGKLQISCPPEPLLFVQVRGTFYKTDVSSRLLQENGARKEVRFHASLRITDDLMAQILRNTNIQSSIVTLNPAVQKVKDVLFRGKEL